MSPSEGAPHEHVGARTSFPIQFRGWVACRREEVRPLGLTLIGATVDRPGEVVRLAFTAGAPHDLPEALEQPRIEQLDTRRFQLTSGSRSWTIDGAAHVHREVGRAFYEAVPARRVPWRKRVFWRVLLSLVGNRLAQRVLLSRRG